MPLECALRDPAEIGHVAPPVAIRYAASCGAADLEAFVNACERSRDAHATGELLIAAARRQGFDKAAFLTHGDVEEFGTFAVLAHNFGAAFDESVRQRRRTLRNPLLRATELDDQTLYWNAAAFKATLDADGLAWMAAARESGLRDGISQRIRVRCLPASFSVAPSQGEADFPAFRRLLRMASHAFSHILVQQQPLQATPEMLTEREYQCLVLAIIDGLRPQQVAVAMGVTIHTVRSLRKSALRRLGARSQEESVWRMIETGQLFVGGRPSRLRSR